MDHRRGHRLPATISTNIKSNRVLLGNFKTLDIGAGGVCVDDKANHLSEGDFVSLELETCIPEQPEHYSMKAIVVYRDNQKAGLMWAGYDPDFAQFLHNVAVASVAA